MEQSCNQLTEQIKEIACKFERLSRSCERPYEIERLMVSLSLNSANSAESAKLPCLMLPKVNPTKFYDRDEIIESINNYLTPDQELNGPGSLALHGLGGVGKSYIAMKYAYSKCDEVQAIFWVRSENAAAIEQSFTDIALRMGFDEADFQNHIGNRVLVLNWLQKTSMKPQFVRLGSTDCDQRLNGLSSMTTPKALSCY